MKLFAAFSKVEENDDGTLTIEGIASTESVDSDGEVVKAAAIEAALPDYMRYGSGAMREMHQPLAAGTVDKAEVIDGVTHISGTVVDPVAISKVKAQVYKGFSIGGKVTSRDELNKKHVTGVRLVEISLVDRPANPGAVISMWKAEGLDETDDLDKDETAEVIETAETVIVPPNKGDDFEQVWVSKRDKSQHPKKADLIAHHKALDDAAALDELAGPAMGKIGEIETAMGKRVVSTAEREKDAKDGHALPDGSFPIDSVSDLENAVKAYGRAKNKASAKRHIIKRAKALGATDKLPDGWVKKVDDGGDLSKALSLESVANMLQLLACIDRAEDSFEYDYFWSDTAVMPTPELKTRFGSLLVEFGAIIRESLDLVLAAMTEEEATEALQRGDMAIDIMKAGARHSSADMADLQAAHDALVKLGADCGMEKHEGAEDLAKAEEPTDLSKALHELDLQKQANAKVLGRLDELVPQITDLAKRNADMAKRLKEIEDQPLPAKTAGAMAISKETDTIGASAEPVITKAEAQRMFDELSPDDRALALIKVARGNPIALNR